MKNDHRLHVDVQGDEIRVTLSGTSFEVVYQKRVNRC
jgi:hypothetical protein